MLAANLITAQAAYKRNGRTPVGKPWLGNDSSKYALSFFLLWLSQVPQRLPVCSTVLLRSSPFYHDPVVSVSQEVVLLQ